MELSLKGLRCLVAVAEELHFGRAAERLGIAQPAVSQQLQRLEASVNLQLVHRDGRRVVLTDAGRGLLPHARRVLAAGDQGLKAARAAARGEAGELTVGLTASVPPAQLVDLLRRYGTTRPEIEVTVRETTLEEVFGQLTSGEIQAAVTTGFAPPPGPDEIVFVELASEPLMAAIPEEHPLASAGRPLTLPDMAAERFAVIGRDVLAGRPLGVQGMCEREGFTPLVFAEVRDTMMQLAMVATGRSVAILPRSAARYAPPEVRFLPIDYDRPLRTLLGYDTRVESPALRALVDMSKLMVTV
ncbi:LysR substrate-binding domain-containing protein [Kutzneria sp. NPDC052558]|uniref:LysR substrate-binding domain-containing protein n=1 Tax=Kutzneria sp. NPDC052558 TaxID=3364121 RepID=UPI0037C70800